MEATDVGKATASGVALANHWSPAWASRTAGSTANSPGAKDRARECNRRMEGVGAVA